MICSIKDFASAADMELSLHGQPAIANLHGPFRGLIGSTDVISAVNAEALKLRDDFAYEAPLWSNGEFQLGLSDHWTLRLAVYMSVVHQDIYTFPWMGWFGLYRGGSVTIRKYLLPDDYDNDRLDLNLRLSAPEDCVLQQGDVMFLDGRRFAFSFHVDKPAVMIKFFSQPVARLQWKFDSSTRGPEVAIAADVHDTELVSLAKTLGALGDRAGLPVLEGLTKHERHFVRWAAIQGIGALDRPMAMDALRTATDDPHPEVRSSATRILQRIGSQGG